ncbi:MAG TPA: 4-hydroxy-tetrahydrodipicolinate reductase [Caulobacteraceae bacterium]
MSGRLRVGIAGALGRMGQAVAAAVDASEEAEAALLFDRPGTKGHAAGGRPLGRAADAADAADVVIDFTTAEASTQLARRFAKSAGPALVIGSTGFTPGQEAEIRACAERLAIVKSGNFSLGVSLLLGLVRQAARALPDYDIEVFEAHHRRKADAPSGTALMLAAAAAEARCVHLADAEVRARDGQTGPRPDGAIGFSVMRAGGIVGEHSVVLASEDEVLTLSHSARDRALFARGAVTAALWLKDKPPGLYGMDDVLGLER